MSNFVATDVYALFNIHVEKCVKKTSDLAEDGFPKLGQGRLGLRRSLNYYAFLRFFYNTVVVLQQCSFLAIAIVLDSYFSILAD